MYTLATFFFIFSSYILVTALRKQSFPLWILYGVLVAATLYTHYLTAFGIIAQAIFVLFWIAKDEKLHLLSWLHNSTTTKAFVAYLLSFILFLPWLPTFFAQLNQVQTTFWIPPITIWSLPIALFAMLSGAGATDPGNFGFLLVGAVVAVLTAMIIVIIKYKTKEAITGSVPKSGEQVAAPAFVRFGPITFCTRR